MTNLAAAGIDPKAIDTVIISHYHGDHMNGLFNADNSLAFPNAEILVPAGEHKFWMDDGEMSRAPEGPHGRPVQEQSPGVLRRGDEALAHLRVGQGGRRPASPRSGTPGHSAGHTSHIVSSGSSKVYVQADVTHVPFLFARNPGWHAFYDQDPVMAEATRRKVYDMLVAEKMLVQGFHYPFPSLAYVEKSGSGYREIAVPWNPTI